MARCIRIVLAGVAVLLTAACASEQDAPEPPPAVGRSDADTYFAMFVNDPTNRDGWRWLCRAATGGHAAAQYTVGVRYREGMPPVTRNASRAYLWFAAASRSGLTAATLAAEQVAKTLPEARLEKLRKESRSPAEADCREES